jgi:hypothetical protein
MYKTRAAKKGEGHDFIRAVRRDDARALAAEV